MKIFVFAVLTLSLCAFLSCKKGSENPEPNKKPLQLVKTVKREEFGGKIFSDSVGYTYDAAGHLIMTTNLKNNLPTARFVYDGENLVARILVDANGKFDTLRNFIKMLDGGNTIFMDFTQPGSTDTVHVTYKWSGTQLIETLVYLHSANVGPHLERRVYSYDASGNQVELFLITGGRSFLQSRALAYDNKKNYYSTTPRLNYIFSGLESRSVNNATRVESGGGQVTEYIWTYNKEDYPLTLQVKGQNFLTAEFTYNK